MDTMDDRKMQNECQAYHGHKFPNMRTDTRRKCMICGIEERDAIAEETGKEFERLAKILKDEELKEQDPYYKWLKDKKYSAAQLLAEACTQQTMYQAWRKRAEQSEAEFNQFKAAQQAAKAGEWRGIESCPKNEMETVMLGGPGWIGEGYWMTLYEDDLETIKEQRWQSIHESNWKPLEPTHWQPVYRPFPPSDDKQPGSGEM